ncbi:unnamed protein product [Leptosia nina]|uniref:Uncharacterized protein n=1 Tax=Leptosia nina TaxID=320188 RepID=A0AAV1JPI3_9NEOP
MISKNKFVIRENSMKNHSKTQKWSIKEEVPNYNYRINPDEYSIRVTRSLSKIIDCIQNFHVVEVYKCMPLLGDETEIPNWDIHVARYAIVFKKSI